MWDSHIVNTEFAMSVSGTCFSGAEDGDWYGTDNDLSQYWWETQATINDICDGGETQVGCAHYELGWWDGEIYEADAMVANDATFEIVNQDAFSGAGGVASNINDCLRLGNSAESAWLHEIGHAYGLGHRNTEMARMNPVQEFHKNCHLAQAVNESPWPDDLEQLFIRYDLYSDATTGVTASPFYRNAGGFAAIDQASYLGSGTDTYVGAQVTFNLEKIGLVNDVEVFWRVRVLPNGSSPTFNWGTNSFTWPSGEATVQGGGVHTSYVDDYDLQTTLVQFNVLRSSMDPTLVYRVWIQLDSSNDHAEPDEGDNAIPTAVYVVR
jgi:hypothetical protein